MSDIKDLKIQHEAVGAAAAGTGMASREKALEDAYFAREDEEKIKKLREGRAASGCSCEAAEAQTGSCGCDSCPKGGDSSAKA